MRFFIFFSYNGTAYHGWQFQPNAISVQERMESAFKTLLRQPVTLTAAGRTDTGVHARLMVAHFDLPEQLSIVNCPLSIFNLNDFAFKLNGLLPSDITVHKIVPVRPDAHARFDALSRTYEYWVTDIKNPFTEHLITYTRFQLDYDKMNEAAKILLETKDFASFCKAHSDNKTTLCDVRRAFWEPRPLPFMSSYGVPKETKPLAVSHGESGGPEDFNEPVRRLSQCPRVPNAWVFTIESDRFLRNMVRAVVGTLFEVGRGNMTIDEMRRAVEAHDRCAAGQSMPPDGLYLTDIRYPDRIFL